MELQQHHFKGSAALFEELRKQERKKIFQKLDKLKQQ
jgi:hypothetical protein